MERSRALEILSQTIKDYRNWGHNAQLRVGQDELIAAIVNVEDKLFGDWVPKEELTLANRRYAATNAQLQKHIKRGSGNGDASESD